MNTTTLIILIIVLAVILNSLVDLLTYKLLKEVI